jgi:hypothetical protein
MRTPRALLALPLVLLVPASAHAQEAPTMKLSIERGNVVPTSDRFVVRGVVTPYVPGQFAVVRVYRGARKLRARRVAILAGGRFRVGLRSGRRGRLTVRASHRATPELPTIVARAVPVRVVRPSAGAGARGPLVSFVQRRLRAMGYKAPRTRRYDAATARAVHAFRKVVGMRRTTVVDRAVVSKLRRGAGRFRAKFPTHGRHVEADLSRQVIALLQGRRVVRVLSTSSGTPATPTVRGHFRFYRKDPGTNALGMVHSSYFIGGYAIHGYASVPPFPASHGCLRIPIPDAAGVFAWVRRGDRIDVYP